MSEGKRTLAGTTGSAIAALLALAGMAGTAVAAPPAAKKVAAKKVAKKKVVAKKTAKKKVAKKIAPPPPTIVYLPAPPMYAPPAPPAPPAYADAALYRYIDDADALLDTVGASPPDYGFRYDGIDCWAWELSGGDLVLAEPVGDHYRFYAFAAGDAYPFFVGDNVYSYGFAGRALAAVYGSDAQLIAWSPADAIASGGAWLSERGRAMRVASARRAPVSASDWASGLYYFSDIELRFGDWRAAPGWSRYRIGTGSRHRRDWRARLGNENSERRDRADRFDRWRRDGYRGTPPQNNGGWTTGSRPGTGQGGWNGRPRPVAPATPGAPPAPPRADRSGDGQPRGNGPGRWPRRGATPPVAPTPAPATGARPSRGGTGAASPPPAGGASLPPPVYVAPQPTPRPGYDPNGKRQMLRDRLPDTVPVDPPAPRVVAPVEAGQPDRPPPPAPLPAPVYVAPPPAPAPVEAAPPPAPAPVYVAPPPAVEAAPPPPPPSASSSSASTVRHPPPPPPPPPPPAAAPEPIESVPSDKKGE